MVRAGPNIGYPRGVFGSVQVLILATKTNRINLTNHQNARYIHQKSGLYQVLNITNFSIIFTPLKNHAPGPLQDASTRFQDAPRRSKEGSKDAPRRFQDGLRRSRGAPKTLQDGSKALREASKRKSLSNSLALPKQSPCNL